MNGPVGRKCVRKRLSLPIVAVVLVACAGCPAPPPWEYVSKEHKFRVRFGSEPDVRPNTDAFTKSTLYIVESAGGTLLVLVRDMPVPDDATPERLELFLHSAEDDLIRFTHAERVSSASTALAGKYPGREFTARFQQPWPGVLRARIYVVGKRLYWVMVKGTDEYANAPAATAFLDSFMVTE
jgi:hypothetical protein